MNYGGEISVSDTRIGVDTCTRRILISEVLNFLKL